MEITERKKSLRQRMLLQRKNISPVERQEKQSKIQQQCIELCDLWLNHQQYVAAYRARSDELNLDSCLFNSKYQWLFPKVHGADLKFYQCQSEEDFELGSFGIQEPKTTCPEISIDNCHIVFVPGVAFDRRGRRLGMGKGYYDKSLAATKALKVGVGFECQIVDEELPHEPHDLLMDFIITENFTITPIHVKRTS